MRVGVRSGGGGVASRRGPAHARLFISGAKAPGVPGKELS